MGKDILDKLGERVEHTAAVAERAHQRVDAQKQSMAQPSTAATERSADTERLLAREDAAEAADADLTAALDREEDYLRQRHASPEN